MAGLLRKLIPLDSLQNTIARFPLSSICSFIVFIVLFLSTNDVIDLEDNNQRFARVLLLFIFGFFWLGLAKIFQEYLEVLSRSGNPFQIGNRQLVNPKSIVPLIALLVFALVFFVSFLFSSHYFFWTMGVLIVVMLLSIGIGPNLLHRNNDQFWTYNFRIWLGSLIASLAGIIWGAGLSLAFASIQYLFEIDMPDDIYLNVWMFAMSVFVPLYALSWIPETQQQEQTHCSVPVQLTFILNWVLAPLLIFYLFILYAYFIKIAIGQELPRGQLSYMVTAFGSVGLLTYLAGWPIRETGNGLLRLVYRYFFPALLIPAFVQGLSIYTRVAQYGITELRYMVVLFVFWFIFLSITYSVKKIPLKFIPGSLAILLLVFALGPFSAPIMSVKSQVNRLERIFLQNELLEEGLIKQAEEALDFDTRLNISSILRFLEERDRLHTIQHLLPADIEENNLNASYISQQLGFTLVNRYMAGLGFETIHIGGLVDQMYVIAGYDYLVMQQSFACPMQGCENLSRNHQIASGPEILITFDQDILSLVINGSSRIDFNLAETLAQELLNGNMETARTIELESGNTIYRVKLIINNLSAVSDANSGQDIRDFHIQSMFYSILIDI